MGTEGNRPGQRIGGGQRRPGRQGHPVGVLAERLAVSLPLDPFLSLKALASYAGLSVRKLRDLLVDPGHPLPAYQVGTKILVRRSEFDVWMAAHRRSARALANDHLIDEMLHGLSPDRRPRRRRSIRAGEG